jgi:hypothetical protein
MKKIIVVVDRDRDARTEVVLALEARGWECVAGSSITEVESLLKMRDMGVVVGGGSLCTQRIDEVHQIRQRYPSTPILLINAPLNFSIERAFGLGAEAVYHRSLRVDAIHRLLVELTSLQQSGFGPRSLRTQLNTHILAQFRVEEPDDAPTGHVLNIGIGGMFCSWDQPFPDVGTVVKFKIHGQKPALSVEGAGEVRWVRASSSEGFVRGCGLAFSDLASQYREPLFRFINQVRTL